MDSTISINMNNRTKEHLINEIAQLRQRITELKKTEDAFRESENKYRLLFDNLNQSITIFDGKGYILLINAKGADDLGGKPADFIGKSMYHLFPEKADIFMKRNQNVINTGRGCNYEDELELSIGKKWFWSNLQPVKNKSGTIYGVQIISYDITEHKQAEAKLKLASDEWRMTFDSIIDFVSVIDKDFKYIKVNKSLANFLGTTPQELINQYCYKVFHSLDKPFSGCPLKEMMTSKRPVTKEIYNDNLGLHLLIVVSPIFDEKGEFKGAVHFAKDVTERIKMQELIIKAKKEWEGTFDIVREAITIHDMDFNVIRANKAAEKLLGLPFKKIIGQKCFSSYHGTDLPPERCASCQTLKTEKASTTEIFEPYLSKYLKVAVLPQFNEKGQLNGLVHVVNDITDRKRMEKELRDTSITDELTGLYNRRGFFTLAKQQLKTAAREKKMATILYADLDDFKCINDKYGHHRGDKVLIETAKILKKSFRDSDIIARMGGDEFAILTIETPETNVKSLTARLKQNLTEYNEKGNKLCGLSLSLGSSQISPENPCSIYELISKADKLMYEQKKNKKKA